MIFNPRSAGVCGGVALLTLAVLGFAGCAEDNEASATKTTGNTAAVKDTGPPPKDQREYFERRQKEGGGTSKGNNYPGAK
jgi:hypothetical protein